MNPYLIIAALAAVLAAGAGGFKLGADHEVAAQAREDKHITEAIEKATDVSAKAIAGLKVKSTTITNEVQREIKTNTVYADCKLTPGGLHLANQALTPSNDLTLGGGKLPKTDAPSR